jgi:hypothetical protein
MSPALVALVGLLLLAGATVPPPSAFACRSDANCTNSRVPSTACRICESQCRHLCDSDIVACDCSIKVCFKPQLECDDGDGSTIDHCDPISEVCLHQKSCTPFQDNECDDLDPCTVDTCGSDMVCSHKMKPNCCTTQGDCDDANPCTADFCMSQPGSSGVCVNDPSPHIGERCGAGSCMQLESPTVFIAMTCQPNGDCGSTSISCTDGKDCTMDSCDPEQGCQFRAIPGCICETDAACGANACDRARCQEDHQCTGPMPVSCDSGDECTKDGCDPATGCTHKPVTCDDGGPCTDSCRQGCQERHSPAFFEHVSCWAMKSVCEDIPAGSNDCLNRVVRTLMKTAPDANRKRKRHSARAALACARRLIGTRGISDNCAMELQDLENRINDWLAANVHKPASQRTRPPAATKLKTVAAGGRKDSETCRG